jgi:hypothetical protein
MRSQDSVGMELLQLAIVVEEGLCVVTEISEIQAPKHAILRMARELKDGEW